jgi:hypothetical protein
MAACRGQCQEDAVEALISLPGGSRVPPLAGSGTFYFTDGTKANLLAGAGVWLIDAKDLNYQNSAFVLVAIVKKRLHLSASRYEILQILSLTIFEKIPLDQLLAQTISDQIQPSTDNQLNSFAATLGHY